MYEMLGKFGDPDFSIPSDFGDVSAKFTHIRERRNVDKSGGTLREELFQF